MSVAFASIDRIPGVLSGQDKAPVRGYGIIRGPQELRRQAEWGSLHTSPSRQQRRQGNTLKMAEGPQRSRSEVHLSA